MLKRSFELCVFMAIFLVMSCQEYKIIQTSSGKVRGLVETVGDEKVFRFRGIPYAKPPVGNLRFRKPQSYGSWEYTLDATKDTSPCMQMVSFGSLSFVTNDRISEDCLFLNIHVPRDVSVSNNKTVMVWFHGGGFFMGQGSWYDGSYLAVKGDVIVVTINYRLGIFGFLSTYDQASPGNYGLWDQRMALAWVQSNIAAFGGNPSSVTIFGESAGGLSTSYQSIIPYNRGLFQRVIAQSGVSLSVPLATSNNRLLEYLAEIEFCADISPGNTYGFVECLRQKSAEELMNVSSTFLMKGMAAVELTIALGPSIDGDLFKSDPSILLSDKSSLEYKFFQSLDYMSGTTDGEGSLVFIFMSMLSEQLKINLTEGIPTRVLCDVFCPKVAASQFNNATGAAKALCEKYTVEGGETDKMMEQGVQIANIYGDMFFVSPTVKTLIYHGQENNKKQTYHYLFTKASNDKSGMSSPPWFKHAGHGSEIMFLFGEEMFKMTNTTMSNEDRDLQDKMVEYWTNFAKFGNPNSESLPTWTEFGKDQNYLQIDYKITSDNKLYSDRMKFLQEEMPKIVEKAAGSKHEEL